MRPTIFSLLGLSAILTFLSIFSRSIRDPIFSSQHDGQMIKNSIANVEPSAELVSQSFKAPPPTDSSYSLRTIIAEQKSEFESRGGSEEDSSDDEES